MYRFREYWINGYLRRKCNDPCIEYGDGTKEWYQDNILHRYGGPARILADGTEEYYLKGVKLTISDNKIIMDSSHTLAKSGEQRCPI